jgi:uncharacterized Tic20 family protein
MIWVRHVKTEAIKTVSRQEKTSLEYRLHTLHYVCISFLLVCKSLSSQLTARVTTDTRHTKETSRCLLKVVSRNVYLAD